MADTHKLVIAIGDILGVDWQKVPEAALETAEELLEPTLEQACDALRAAYAKAFGVDAKSLTIEIRPARDESHTASRVLARIAVAADLAAHVVADGGEGAEARAWLAFKDRVTK